MNDLYNLKGIYGIKNLSNNKIYIGKTQMNFGDRRDSHYSKLNNNKHDNQHLQNAWNKYGKENFQFVIIENIDKNQSNDFFNDREKFWIKYYKDQQLSYNITDGGDGAPGKIMSEDTKRKIGQKNKINMMGKKASLETKNKMSKTHLENWNSKTEIQKQEFRNKCKGNNLGHICSEQQKQQLSNYFKKNPSNRKYSDETILKIRYLYEIKKYTKKQISEIMNIPPNYISAITLYKSWSELKLTNDKITYFDNN